MIFNDLGLSSTTTALFAQGIYGVVKVVTCLIFIFFLADSLGRRLSFMWSGILQAFCMLYLGFVSGQPPLDPEHLSFLRLSNTVIQIVCPIRA
jgi:hypothetical protein